MSRFILSLVLCTTVFAVHSQAAPRKSVAKPGTAATTPAVSCGEGLLSQANLEALGLDKPSNEALLRDEKHSLASFFDPNNGLGLQRPLVAMNAAQRVLAMIHSQPQSLIRDPLSPEGKVARFDFFSAGGPATGGRRVIKQYRSLESIHTHLGVQAKTQRGFGAKVVLLRGTPAAGKSEGLETIREGYLHLPDIDPRFRLYTIRWKNLRQIPSLALALPEGQDTFQSPMAPSPIHLLPPKLANQYLQAVRPLVVQMSGVDGPIYEELNFQDAYFKNEILKHAGGGRTLTQIEELRILNEFVEIVPLYGEALRAKALFLPRQSKPVNYKALFWSENTAVKLIHGSRHPLAYHLTGSFPAANGGVILLDEVMKNEKDFLDKLLTFFQSRRLTDGEISVPLDVVIVAATNDREFEETQAKDPQSPLVSRFTQTPLYWTIRPGDTAKVTLYESRDVIQVTPLQGEDRAPFTLGARPAAIDDLLPETTSTGENNTFPDGRFSLSYLSGNPDVAPTHLAPHTLLMLTSLAALTRSSFDAKSLEGAGFNIPLLEQPVFRNPVARLRYLLGKSDITESQRDAMEQYGQYLKEGSFGWDHRVLSEVLPRAQEEAKKAHGCITPTLVRRVIASMAKSHSLHPNEEEVLKWMQYFPLIERHFVVPQMRSDIRRALLGSRANETLRRTYRQLIYEMNALSLNPDATEYVMSGTRDRIQKTRLREIRQIYREHNAKDLNIEEISRFHTLAIQLHGEAPVLSEPNAALEEAILEWQQRQITSGLNAGAGDFTTLIGVGSGRMGGDDESRGSVMRLADNLKASHGYCDHCIKETFALVDRHNELDRQDPEEK